MHVAFALLPQLATPDADLIAAAYEGLFPDRSPLVPTGTEAADDGVPMAALACEDGAVHVMVVGEPVPGEEVARGVGHSLAAIGQEPGPPEHAAHLVVAWFPREGATPTEGLQAQARVTAAVALAAGAVGVFVGAASATHPAEWYVEVARQVEEPTMLWVGVSHVVDDAQRHSFLSFGMHQFGLPDLLLTAPLDEGSEALEFFYEIVTQASQRGVMIEAGETVGRSESEQIPVRMEPNPVDEEMVVMCVDLGPAQA